MNTRAAYQRLRRNQYLTTILWHYNQNFQIPPLILLKFILGKARIRGWAVKPGLGLLAARVLAS
jgi:hypothetical protein